jgi:hypothetical protein
MGRRASCVVRVYKSYTCIPDFSNIPSLIFSPWWRLLGRYQMRFFSLSTADHIFCIRQILEKKWEYNEAMRQLFIDFKKAYDSVRREVLYNLLIEFGIPMKLVRVVKCV